MKKSKKPKRPVLHTAVILSGEAWPTYAATPKHAVQPVNVISLVTPGFKSALRIWWYEWE